MLASKVISEPQSTSDLFQDGIATQLQVNLLRRVQVVDCQRRDLHDIANIEQVQPLALVEVSKENFHVDRFFNTSQFASASALPVRLLLSLVLDHA